MVAAAAFTLMTGCGGDGSVDPIGNDVTTLTLSIPTLNVPKGSTGSAILTIARRAGYTGSVTLSSEGTPTGVTVTFSPASLSGSATQSTMTVDVTPTATAGTYTVTIRAKGAGADSKTATLTLVVTTPSIVLSASPTVVLIVAGQSGTPTITISRSGGFAGNVNFAVEGNPAGVSATFAPNGTAGNSTVMTINTTTAAARGPVNLTVRATGTGIADATTVVAAQINDAPGIGFTLTSAAQSIAAGANGANTLTLARLGDFTGAVTLSVGGLPTGVTTNLPATIAAGTSNAPFTITVPSSSTPNVYPIVITGTGTGGITAQTTLTLTVTAAAGVTLGATPATVTIPQNASGQSTITVNRTGGFAGTVNLTITGLPAGITPTFTPAALPTGATTSQLSLAVGGAVQAQTYNALVRANATGLSEVTIPLTVTVTATGSANAVTWRFCETDDTPVWFGYRDGNGAWTRVNVGANNTFTFDINASTGSVTYVLSGNRNTFTASTFYQTRAELIALGTSACANVLVTRNFTGTIVGIPLDRTATISAGRTITIVNGNGPYSLIGAPGGRFDVIASRNTENVQERAILRRNLNPPANSALALLDFESADAFALANAQITLQNGNGERMALGTAFLTSNGKAGNFFTPSLPAGNTTATITGIPATHTAAGDLHNLSAFTLSSDRAVFRYMRDITNQAIAFGPVLTLPTISTIATTPYARLRSSGTWMAEYATAGTVSYEQDTRLWEVFVSRGFNAAGTYQIDIPDLSGVTGFLSSWGLLAGATTTWTATFSDLAANSITDGGGFKTAARTGTITP